MSKLKSLLSGVQWGTVSIATVTMFQLIFMAIMARLLDPADFGLVAIANVALRFYSYFSQMGIGPALIQKKTLSDGDVRAALALSLGVSSLFFLLAFLTAGLIERFFEMDSLEVVMQVLAINFIIFAFSSISLSLIRRNRDFKSLAIIEIVSYVVGYGLIGLTAAYAGAGVWALVAAFLSQTLISAILSYVVIRHPLGLKHTKEERSHILGYGGRYSVLGFIEFLTSNLDSLLVGKLLGATIAGYYNRALLLATLPIQQPTKVLTQVLFPILSTMSDEHEKQSISIQLSSLVVGTYAFAAGFGIFVASEDIVLVLLGEKWIDSIPVLQVLACAVGPIYMSNVIGITLDSMAKLSIKLRVQFSVLVLLLILMALVSPTGDVINIAMVVVIAFWFRLFLMGVVIIRLLDISMAHVARVILGIIMITLTTVACIYVASDIMFTGNTAFVRLLFEMIFGLIGMVFGVYITRSLIIKLPAVLFLTNRSPFISKLLRIN